MQYRHVIAVCATAFAVLSAPLAHAQTTPPAGDSTAASEMAPTTKKQARADNRILSKAVRRSLTKTKGLDASAITILSRGGKVTLDGTVPDASQIQLAGNAAIGTHGVTQVDNRLIMREAGH
jgi:hyperosmotically inducible protein